MDEFKYTQVSLYLNLIKHACHNNFTEIVFCNYKLLLLINSICSSLINPCKNEGISLMIEEKINKKNLNLLLEMVGCLNVRIPSFHMNWFPGELGLCCLATTGASSDLCPHQQILASVSATEGRVKATATQLP